MKNIDIINLLAFAFMTLVAGLILMQINLTVIGLGLIGASIWIAIMAPLIIDKLDN